MSSPSPRQAQSAAPWWEVAILAAWVGLGVELWAIGTEPATSDAVLTIVFYLGVGLDLVFRLIRRLSADRP